MTTPHHDHRYHALDQLRASMMLLGLVIHTAVSFTAAPLGAVWPYQDANTHVLFDSLAFAIHLFRMPLFFLMAGFFTAFLYFRRGPMMMLRNRTMRVAVPFLLFLPIVFPLTQSGFRFSMAGGVDGGWSAALQYLADPTGWYQDFDTTHLWFLYYLILFYAAILVVAPPVGRLSRPWAKRIIPMLGRQIHRPIGFFVCIMATFLTLLPMPQPALDVDTAFLVHPAILAAYSIFLLFGWLLYLNQQKLSGFARRAWWFSAAGVLVAVIYLSYILMLAPQYALVGKALAALAMWLLIYGIMGLFVRYYDRPSPVGRYLSDASYWMYLVHLPIIIWVPGLLSGWDISALIKAPVTLGITVFVSLLSYQLLVRFTVIGVLLNGRRRAMD